MSTSQLSINSTLLDGKYRIEAILGQGGFGITYMAVHTILGKRVAIKEFFPKEYCDREESTSHITLGTQSNAELVDKLRKKFIKEAQNISKLNHKNIIQIQDIFEENNTAYYVMEYIEGDSLEDIVNREDAIAPARAIKYMEEIASALSNMHAQKMIHLDVKPANIMIRTKDDCPILIDFGLSKAYSASGGQTSTTPHGVSHGYSPLEQYNPDGVSQFTPQTDIYAFGATLFKLISGQTPPDATKRLENPLEFPDSMGPELRKVIEHCMSLSKNSRPADMNRVLDMLAALPLQTAAGGDGGGDVPPLIPPEQKSDDQGPKQKKPGHAAPAGTEVLKPRKKGGAGKWIVIGIVALAVIGLIIWFATRRSGSNPEAPLPVDSVQAVEEPAGGEDTDIVVAEVADVAVSTPLEEATRPAPGKDPKTPEPKKTEPKKADDKGAKTSADTRNEERGTSGSRPTAAKDNSAVKSAASSVASGNLDAGLRCTGASVQGNTLVFNVNCSSNVFDAEDCAASNPVFRKGINAYIASTPSASAAINAARQQGMSVRFQFSGVRSFSISY